MVSTRRSIHNNTSLPSYVDVAAPPKKLKVSTRRRRDVINTSSSTSILTSPSEIPKSLYDLIQNAARARKSLNLNSNNRFAKRKLEYFESRIRCVAAYFKHITDKLPSDWRYDPETSFMAHVPKLHTPPKPKTKKKKTKLKKIKITWSSPNYHGSYPLNNAENKVWNDFKNNDTAEAKTDKHVQVEKHLNTVDKNDKVVDLLGKFAVDTFNRSFQMYVNNDEDNQISGAEFMECKFYKLTWKYIFYMTIEAIEQGIPGVYETRVECDAEDGEKTLMIFTLMDREPKCM